MKHETRTMKQLISYMLIASCFMLHASWAHAQTSSDSLISATIGDHQFSLYGYTSPLALVTFSGLGIQDQTTADETGYFIFMNRYSPTSPHEACLTAQDQFGRTSQPTCLPPFPVDYQVTIGPVLLPPTLSFQESTYFVNDDAVVTGQTIPSAPVVLSAFDDSRHIKIPSVTAVSDKHGNFSIQLPSNSAAKYRIFTQTEAENHPSPKSNTLQLTIYPIWIIIVQFLLLIWRLLLSHFLEAIILGLICISIWYSLRTFLHPHRAMVLYQQKELMLRPEE